MTKNKIVMIAALALTMGCSSSPKNQKSELDQKIQSEAPANTPEAIAQRAAETFAGAPGLTEAQKSKLMEIYINTYTDARSIRTEMGQAKSLLFKTISTKDYRSRDVQVLKEKIVKLDQARLKLMFKALEDVQKVVGYGEEKSPLFEHFENFEIPYNRLIGTK